MKTPHDTPNNRDANHCDFVLFIARQGAKMTLLRVPADETTAALEQREVDLGNGTFVHLNRVAYMRISHRDAETPQQAANIARDRGLCFIPANIVCGMRHRIPDITIDSIRDEFARRAAAANTQENTPSSAQERDRQQMEDFVRAMGDLFGDNDFLHPGQPGQPGGEKKSWWDHHKP